MTPDETALTGRFCGESNAPGTGRLLVVLVLVAMTLLVYRSLPSHDFVNYDDPLYVAENSRVRGGLTLENVRWALGTGHANFWHPLTWLSFMLDTEIYGKGPQGYLFTNLLLHLANTLILFAVLGRMTGDRPASALVAGLFAVHPLHVESVAWISQRKDVLSTLFWMLAMWAYARYGKRPGRLRYLAVMAALVLGLMAKPMLVTLPFVFLMLDVWPLNRTGHSAALPGRVGPASTRRPLFALVMEKVPFLLVCIAASVLAYVAQARGGALGGLDTYSSGVRVANAIVSYAVYALRCLWPAGLAVYYPHHGLPPLYQIAGAAVFVVGITLLVLRYAKARPWLAFGWFWYLGTLVPVIGLVQIGSFSRADRYTYVPLIGLFIMLAWEGRRWLCRRFRKTAVRAGVLALVFGLLVWRASVQVAYWRDSVSLFSHALAVTRDSYMAHNNLGTALLAQGKTAAAMAEFRAALAIRPDYETAHANLGSALMASGRIQEALAHFRDAVGCNPSYPTGHLNLANALADTGQSRRAMPHYVMALRLNPRWATAHYDYAVALARQGRIAMAADHYRQALVLDPEDKKAHNNLGILLARQGDAKAAIRHLKAALDLDPGYSGARQNLQRILAGAPDAGRPANDP